MALGKKLFKGAADGTSAPNSPLDIAIWTGDGTNPRTISTTNNPDVVILRRRNQISQFYWYREDNNGVIQYISSSSTSPEGAPGGIVLSLNNGGFTLDDSDFSNNSYNFVGWAFQAGGGYSTNTNGSISSQVSANVGGGFSIVTYTGNGTAGATIGHGLSSAPDLVIIKSTSNTSNWIVYSSPTGTGKYLYLNSTAAASSASWFGTSATTFSLNNTYSDANTSGRTYIAYCFHSVDGYQKVGSYTGTGSSGNTVTTGFQPRFVMMKAYSTTSDWFIVDSARSTSDPRVANLRPNSVAAESNAASGLNFTSTGFTFTGAAFNDSGVDWIYLAIA